MSWTRAADLQSQVQRLWDRGELLNAAYGESALFPKKLVLKAPTSAELTQRFDEVRAWIKELNALRYYRIEMREFNHRTLGNNAIPDEVWIDNLDMAANVLAKHVELANFNELLNITRIRHPKLLYWLSRKPLVALSLMDRWEQLLDIVDWVRLHPQPHVYLRQINIAGVHTKVIEAHKGVLSELLELVLPPEAINSNTIGASQFVLRYGFKEKPTLIRFRLLDKSIPFVPGVTLTDVSLDADSFAVLRLKTARVFITENEVNFLSLPEMAGSIAIFGKGYGWEALAKAAWLKNCAIYYWGDIDTHGFAILDQLRGYLPHAESVLMDRETLLHFKSLWGEEPQPINRNLTRLRPNELSLYEELRADSLRTKLRLEQEHIAFDWVMSALKSLAEQRVASN
jgi:hypothetical protein